MAGQTDRKAALQESQLRLRLALRAAHIGIWDWNLATGEMTCSARARAIFGFAPREAITPQSFLDVTHPDDVARIQASAERAIDPGIRDKQPYKYRVVDRRTGEVRWLLAHGEAVFAKVDGITRAIRYIGSVQDITEQKRVEDAIRDSEARQQLAIDAARMAIWELVLATGDIRRSPELNRMFGFPEDAEPSLDEYRAAYAPGERERLQQAAQAALAAGKRHIESEMRCRRPDGKLHWLLLRAEIVLDDNGAPERVIGVLMDIDDRKRAEERQHLLVRELNHRVRNTLSVVQSLASQTFRGDNAKPGKLSNFRGQIHALAKANEVLLDSDWTAFSLRALLDEITAPYRSEDDDPFVIVGDDVSLPPHLTVPLALALHELCTNAAKYGALSANAGRIHIEWSARPDGVTELLWRESGGPAVSKPVQTGFGSRLLSRSLSPDLGEVTLCFDPAGLTCRFLLSTGSFAAGA